MKKLLALGCFLAAIAMAQPAATVLPIPYWQPLGPGSMFYPGAKLCSYTAGTTTPQATYSDSTATTPLPNPVILDTNGGATVWLKQLGYKFILLSGGDGTCSTGAVIGSWDQIWPIFQQTTSLNSLIGSITLAGTSNEVIVTGSGQTITLSTPQAIGTGSSVVFNSVTAVNAISLGSLLLGSTSILDTFGNLSVTSVASAGTISGTGYSNAGTQFLDSSSNLTVHNATITGVCSGCNITTQTNQALNRSMGIVYQNTGTRPMFVVVSIALGSSPSSGISVEALTDTSSSPITLVGELVCWPIGGVNNFAGTLSFFVLPGSYYEIKNTFGVALLNTWMEWQ